MKERVLTAIVLAPIALGAFLYQNHLGGALALLLIFVLAMREGFRLGSQKDKLQLFNLVAASAVYGAYVVYGSFQPVSTPLYQRGLIWAAFMIGPVAQGIVGYRRSTALGKPPEAQAFASLEIIAITLWIFGGMLSFWELVAAYPYPQSLQIQERHYPVLLCLLPIWAGDTMAIFVGKYLGKRPFFPAISPKKTVEGSIAHFVASVVFALLVGYFGKWPMPIALLCGIACGVLGQAGDLFESWLKRQAGRKDSGSLLPGHGGMLDRIDSILFAAPAVLLILFLSK